MLVAWLSFDIRANGYFISEFIHYQIRLFKSEDTDTGIPFYLNFVLTLLGIFPASALIFSSFRKNIHDGQAQNSFKKWMIYLLLVILIVFTIAKTKIVHYYSLCSFPITFLAAYYLDKLFDGYVFGDGSKRYPYWESAF